jgi:mannose-6-phosphate isomerase-like protein (cupin superfamily)
MKKIALILFALFCDNISAQSVINIDTVGLESSAKNIYSRMCFGDSLTSSFCIVIKNEVKLHKHQYHSEHVVVVGGTGLMKLSDKTFNIKVGDVIFIPKNTAHSVKTTSKEPLKVMSIQAPNFDGTDRIMLEEK